MSFSCNVMCGTKTVRYGKTRGGSLPSRKRAVTRGGDLVLAALSAGADIRSGAGAQVDCRVDRSHQAARIHIWDLPPREFSHRSTPPSDFYVTTIANEPRSSIAGGQPHWQRTPMLVRLRRSRRAPPCISAITDYTPGADYIPTQPRQKNANCDSCAGYFLTAYQTNEQRSHAGLYHLHEQASSVEGGGVCRCAAHGRSTNSQSLLMWYSRQEVCVAKGRQVNVFLHLNALYVITTRRGGGWSCVINRSIIQPHSFCPDYQHPAPNLPA